MIEAKITVPKEIIIEGTIKARGWLDYLDSVKIAAFMYSFAWSVVLFIDVITDNTHLIWWHFIALTMLALLIPTLMVLIMNKEFKEKARDQNYSVKLDDSGVYISYNDKHLSWEEYLYYIEFDDYILLRHKNATISFLPKKSELNHIIEFTKSKIPNKSLQPSAESAG